jgi:delta-1-pyrroline-5-carboxylate synthetase
MQLPNNLALMKFVLFSSARVGGRIMQALSSEKRSKIIQDYARSLLSNMDKITEANKLDFDLAQKSSNFLYKSLFRFGKIITKNFLRKKKDLSPVLLSRLTLNEKKIKVLVDGMRQIAENTNILGKVTKSNQLAENLLLKQVTVPIGVLLVIFESRPDSLPQVKILKYY